MFLPPKDYQSRMLLEMSLQLTIDEQDVYHKIIERRYFPERKNHLKNFRILAMTRMKTYFKENI